MDRLFTHQVITPLNTEGKRDPDGLMPIGLTTYRQDRRDGFQRSMICVSFFWVNGLVT